MQIFIVITIIANLTAVAKEKEIKRQEGET